MCFLTAGSLARSVGQPVHLLVPSFLPSLASSVCVCCVILLGACVALARLVALYIYTLFFGGGEKSLAVVATGVVKTATVRIAILLSLSPLLPPFFSSAHFLWLAKKETSALG